MRTQNHHTTNVNLLEANVINMVAGAAFPSRFDHRSDGEQANLDRFFDASLDSNVQ